MQTTFWQIQIKVKNTNSNPNSNVSPDGVNF